MPFEQSEFESLLKKYSPMFAIDRCIQHWIPETVDLGWYLGVYECINIHKAIRELLPEEVHPEVHEALLRRTEIILDEFARQSILHHEQDEIPLADADFDEELIHLSPIHPLITMDAIHEGIILKAIAAVKVHVSANSDDSQRRNALARLYDAVIQLPENDPFWKTKS